MKSMRTSFGTQRGVGLHADFGFWILDFGLRSPIQCPILNRKSEIQNRPGFVLVLVLVVVVLLALAALAFTETMVSEHDAASLYGRQIQSQALADSGVDALRVYLSHDPATRAQLGGHFNNSALFQGRLVVDSVDPRSRGRFSVIMPLGDGYGGTLDVRYGLEDESGRINLNALADLDRQHQGAGSTLLMGLPGMTEDVADAILDWLDADDNPRTMGAESAYYAGKNPPYRPTSGPLDTVEELLMVEGVLPELLFGYDANRNGIVETHERQSLGQVDLASFGGSMDRGWSAYLTLHSMERNVTVDGLPRINLNQEDMELLFDELLAVFPEEWATYIVALRQNGPYEENQENNEEGQGGEGEGDDEDSAEGAAGGNTSDGGGGRQRGGGRGSDGDGGGGRDGGGSDRQFNRGGGGDRRGGGGTGRGRFGSVAPDGAAADRIVVSLSDSSEASLFAQRRGGRGGRGGGGFRGGQGGGGRPGGRGGRGGDGDQGGGRGGRGGGGFGGGATLDTYPSDDTGFSRGRGGEQQQPPPEPESADGRRPDLTQPGQHNIENVLDLIGTPVLLTFEGAQEETLLASPFPDDPAEFPNFLYELINQTTISDAEVFAGRININQAPASLIMALPGITADQAMQIVSLRSPLGADQNLSYLHETWPLEQGIVTLEEMKELMPFVTAQGDVFRAQVIGYYDGGGATSRVEVVIDAASSDLPRILSWRELGHLGKGYPYQTLGVPTTVAQ